MIDPDPAADLVRLELAVADDPPHRPPRLEAEQAGDVAHDINGSSSSSSATPHLRRYGRPMTESVVGLQVEQPGERADELLAAVAAALRLDRVTPDDAGYAPIVVQMPYPDAHEWVARALAEAGDPDGEVVRFA